MRGIDTEFFSQEDLKAIDEALEHMVDMYEATDDDDYSDDPKYALYVRCHYKVMRKLDWLAGMDRISANVKND